MTIEQGGSYRVSDSYRNREGNLVLLRRAPLSVSERTVYTDPVQESLIIPELEVLHEDMEQVTGRPAIKVFHEMQTYGAYPVDSPDEILQPQKDKNDTIATDEMIYQFNKLPYRIDVTTAEGLKDIANGADIPHINGVHGKKGLELKEGEKIGLDAVVDPLEGTTLSVKKMEGVTIAAAIVEHGGIVEIPDIPDPQNPGETKKVEYMQKIFAPNVAGLSIDDPADITVSKVASGLNVGLNRIRVTVLDRPRNQQIIDDLEEFLAMGFELNLIEAGDLLPSLIASDEPGPDGMYNIVLGTGGGPEGLIAAAGAKARGNTFVEARWWPKDKEMRKRFTKKLNINDLVPGKADSIVAILAHVTPDSLYTNQRGVGEYKNGHTISRVAFTSVDIHGTTYTTKNFES